jgi:hypothetical protein
MDSGDLDRRREELCGSMLLLDSRLLGAARRDPRSATSGAGTPTSSPFDDDRSRKRISHFRIRRACPRLLPLIVGTLAALGCETIPLSAESRAELRSVRVSTKVPERWTYSGHLPELEVETRSAMWYGSWITAPVGVIYDLIDWPENERRRRVAFAARLREADVSVPRLVRERLVRGLERRRVFEAIVDADGDATLALEVEHGLDDGLGVRGSWKPWVEVVAELTGENGEVFWRCRASISASDERTGELAEPFRDGRRLESVYDGAVDIVVAELLDHLTGS